MKKQIKSIVLMLCLLIPVLVQAQEIVAGYSLGRGKYLLDDLKTLQEESVKQGQKTFENYKSTETFPEGLFQDAYFGVKFSIHEIGLKYNYLTSGGRNHLADYSGEIKDDMIASGNALGLYYKIHFWSIPLSNHFRLTAHAGIGTGAIYNKLENQSSFILYEPKPFADSYYYSGGITPIIRYNSEFEAIDESIKFRSTNWYAQPHIGIQLGFKNTVFLNLSAGYLFDNQGKLQTAKENTTGYVEISYPNNYYATYVSYSTPGKEYNAGIDWTGLRLSVGIGFAFSVVK